MKPAPAAVVDGLALHSAKGRVALAATVAASSMASLDATVVNVALPHIGRDFHAPVSALQWVLTGYLLSLASLILLGGALGDRYGRRKVYRKLRISSRRDLANAIRDLDSPADDAIRRSSSQL